MQGGGSIAANTTVDLMRGIKTATQYGDGLCLEDRLESFDLKTEEMKDDGNCQFRSLAFNLFGDQSYHAVVRKAVVEYMRQYSGKFSALFESQSEFETYLTEMANDQTWGDEMTLFAAVQVYDCVAHVITSEKEHWYLIYEPLKSKQSGGIRCCPEGLSPPKRGKRLFLSYISPIHYNALIPRQLPDTQSTQLAT
jgi:hypothetical protein